MVLEMKRESNPRLRLVKLVAKMVAVILVCFVSWLCWVWYRTDVLGQTFERVQHGDSQARVIELFGRPSFATSELQTNINWDESWLATNDVRCVQQLHFRPPVSICGEEWVVGFDERSNAVAKYHIVSP